MVEVYGCGDPDAQLWIMEMADSGSGTKENGRIFIT